jgi:Trypsin-like peptidase domain
MKLNGMVAQLSAGPDDNPSFSNGSAWFINDHFALTALHCVQGEDGVRYKNIALKFYGSPQVVAAEIVDAEEKLDVAFLKIKETSFAIASSIPILSLARHSGAINDNILMHGHPAQSLKSSPDGVSVRGKINHSRHPYQGSSGKLVCEVIQCKDISVPPLDGGSGLEGISGGPVILDRNNNDAAAIGLIIDDGLNGGYIHVIPIAAIAARFFQVQEALERSPHLNTDDYRICISLTKDGATLEWSASVSPYDIGQLWCEPRQNKYELHLSAKLPELGKAAHALTRLASYSGVKSIHSPEESDWAKRFNTSCLALHPIAALGTLPAQGRNYTATDLAVIIQASLNNEILKFLNDKLFACLDNNEDGDFGCEIEQQLRDAMWDIWQIWHVSLRRNAALLTSFLIRVFSLDGAALISPTALLAIVPSNEVKKQLLHATIYVLAIAAAGISAQPQEHSSGNFAVGQKTGHTSGVETHNRKRIDRIVADHNWKTEVIFLPFLQQKLLVGLSKGLPLTKPDGTVGCPQKNIFPIAITADREFLSALEQGMKAVLAYYEARVEEVEQQKNQMKSPTRTEALNA